MAPLLTLVLVIVVNLALGLLPPPPGGQLRPHRRPHLRLPPRLRRLHPPAVRLAETSISSSGRSAAAWRATNDDGGGCSAAGLGETQAQDVPVRAVAGRRRAARRRVHGGHRAAVPWVQRERALSLVPLPQLRADQEVEVRRVADHVHGDAAGEHAHRRLRRRQEPDVRCRVGRGRVAGQDQRPLQPALHLLFSEQSCFQLPLIPYSLCT